MSKKYLSAGIGLLLGLAISSTAWAKHDEPGHDWIPITKVVHILKKHGYKKVTKIEADDGHWEGEGIKHGHTYEWHVNPHSGKITKDKRGS
jgi:hypothetical protein